MGGPRVTSGEDSKQDYGTPRDFLDAVEARFGPIIFDLAAHRLNKKNPRYFAPEFFTDKYDPEKVALHTIVRSLIERGAKEEHAAAWAAEVVKNGPSKGELKVKNSDPEAYALDSLAQPWAPLSSKPGVLWLNCEFSDIDPWASKSMREGPLGANATLLTPAMVGANWYRDRIAGRADIYHCNGRISFDGKNVFPKDCMVSHFHPRATGRKLIWEWKKDIIHHEWTLVTK